MKRAVASAYFWASIALLTVLLVVWSDPTAANDVDRTPKLRVEVGTHTAMIRRMAIDADEDFVVTASDDKTIRIWSLDDLRLRNTIRIPTGNGNEGKPYALAVENGLIAIAGWTGLEWDGYSSVYLVSAKSGKILKRIATLPNTAIGFVRFIDDGNYIAIGVSSRADTNGILLADVKTGATIASDLEYGARIWGIDYDPRHGIVTSSYDGQVRLYDRHLRKIGQTSLRAGKRPSYLQFSPDGGRLLVGFADAPSVEILDSSSLQHKASLSADKVLGVTKLPGVTWSASGKTVYAIGDSLGATASVLRWTARGKALPSIDLVAQRLNAIETLQDGRVVVATEDPLLLVLAEDGRILRKKEPQIVRFESLANTLRVSADGSSVAFKQSENDTRYLQFHAEKHEVQLESNIDATLQPALRDHPRLRVSDWLDTHVINSTPSINGRAVTLEAFDTSHSVAISHDGAVAAIGTDWAIHLFDRDANMLWRTTTAEVVWGLNISADGQTVVAALSDGTVRWYRREDGEEYLAAYFHPNQEDWIAWTPAGYYTSSPNGDQFIGWHINRGANESADFYRAVQFERVLFRPDIVASHFANRGRKSATRPNLGSIAPPRIEMSELRARAKGAVGRAQAVIEIAVERNSLPMRDYGVYVNNIPVIPASDRLLDKDDRDQFTRKVVVNLHDPDNLVRIEVFNGKSMGLLEKYVEGPKQSMEPPKGDLYLFAVGAGRFDNDQRCSDPDRQGPAWRWRALPYASDDAVAVRDLFLQSQGTTFNNVHWRLLSDTEGSEPTRANIEQELQFVKSAGPNDTVIVFLASHGLSNAHGNYFFVPRDGSIEDGCRLFDDRDDIETLVSWETFFETLRVTAGRRLMIVDTCNSGDMKIDDKFDAFSLTKRSTSSSFALMSAATGTQDSQPFPAGGQGLFTFSVLDSITKGFDPNGDGWTTLKEVFDYSGDFVEQNRPKRNLEQTPVLVDPEPLGNTRLGRASGEVGLTGAAL